MPWKTSRWRYTNENEGKSRLCTTKLKKWVLHAKISRNSFQAAMRNFVLVLIHIYFCLFCSHTITILILLINWFKMSQIQYLYNSNCNCSLVVLVNMLLENKFNRYWYFGSKSEKKKRNLEKCWHLEPFPKLEVCLTE